ncbi:MAG: TonB-dependent receptor, partial [Rhodobacteraceae bacterium]|nr:TonB-dependent receptor [Paracoccaceae bacterium]
ATLEELLNTGIVRYFYAGGQTLLILVDGRPFALSTSDLDSLPLSAIERIELLSGEGLGQFGGVAVNGAINVVMRKNFDGIETRTLTRVPSETGGESWQGSVFWGGQISENGGRMSIGVDVLKRQEIPSSSREYSRSTWKEGGSFSEAKNVSLGGNTLYVFDLNGSPAAIRVLPLGDCKTEDGYTGPLLRPPGASRAGDKGCGFAYGNIAWNTSEFEQRTAIINLELPLEGGQEFHLYANIGQGKSSFRYAPSIGTFRITPNSELLTAINSKIDETYSGDDHFTADSGDAFVIAHRFRGHGNRDWHTKYDEYDLSFGIDGFLTDNIDYKSYITAYNLDGSEIGNTLVHTDTIQQEIEAGLYDLTDPTSPDNQDAIEKSSLEENLDFGSEYIGAKVSFEGQTFSIADRKVPWLIGFDIGRSKIHSILQFYNNQGESSDVNEVLGSGGVSYQGERKTIGVFGDIDFPLTNNTNFRVAARNDNYDDLGELRTYHLSSEHRPNSVLTLRTSWSKGDRAPSTLALHSTSAQDHPYVQCVPDDFSATPRECTNPTPRQVTRELKGNPELEPSNAKRIAFGAGLNWQSLFLDVEWYRLERKGLPGLRNATWALFNLDECPDGNDEKSNCVDSEAGGAITIYDSFANILDTKISGITTRYRRNYETDWGEIVLSGAWRHVIDATSTVGGGTTERYATSENMVRSRFEARRGDVTATWTVNYRQGFRNQSDTGNFDDWLGHDFYVDWKKPWGMEKSRLTAGVFNLTNESLTVDTANPSSVDGPEAAGWGRTFFLTFNRKF